MIMEPSVTQISTAFFKQGKTHNELLKCVIILNFKEAKKVQMIYFDMMVQKIDKKTLQLVFLNSI